MLSSTTPSGTDYPGIVIRMATCGITVRPLGDALVQLTAQVGEPLAVTLPGDAAKKIWWLR